MPLLYRRKGERSTEKQKNIRRRGAFSVKKEPRQKACGPVFGDAEENYADARIFFPFAARRKTFTSSSSAMTESASPMSL